MSMSNKHKSEATLEKSELPGWLRGLADALEAGELAGESGPVSLEKYRSLKISLKETFDGKVRAKLGVKFPRPALVLAGEPGEPGEEMEPGEGEALPKYKSLKKHMKQTFRTIGAALLAGQLPPALEAQSFIADSRLMVSYPGKGDEFYAAYLEKTNALEAALSAQDLEAAKALYHELAQLKRDCHSRYA
jgi:XXXCH domain-containing protein